MKVFITNVERRAYRDGLIDGVRIYKDLLDSMTIEQRVVDGVLVVLFPDPAIVLKVAGVVKP